MPERVFEQEYLAEFLEDSAVFRHIMAAVKARGQSKPIQGHKYVIGCDWGKMEDFTVFVVMDATNKEVAAIERMNQVDYVTQADRLEYLVKQWNPQQVVTETTGVGEPIADILRNRSIGIRSFKTTRRSKEDLIGWLIRAFDENEIGIIDHQVLIAELQMMEASPTTTGFRYEAPAGYHDDCVMALALAWDGVRKSGAGARVIGKRVIA
jgi:phage FluMu gp28-like protein